MGLHVLGHDGAGDPLRTAQARVAAQREDGSWGPAEPLQGTRLYRLERKLRAHPLTRPIAVALAWWDERALG